MPSPTPPPRPEQQRLDTLLERTARLHRLTAHLSTALRIDEVAHVVVDEGTDALEAATGALWRVDAATNQLELVRALKYPPEAVERVRRLPIDPQIPIADAVLRGEPVWLSSKRDYAQRYQQSAERMRVMDPSAEYSVAALPIVLAGRAIAVLALRFDGERSFDADERTYLMFLAVHCAQGFERARLYEAAEAARERAQFLYRASALLGSSLEYEETLRNVANIAVPQIGDWCAVELVEDDGSTRQVAVAHIDPAKVEMAHELRRRYPPDPDAPHGMPNVLRTGRTELYPIITDAMLVSSARDDEHLRISRELGLTSAMLVPMRDGERVVGGITFISARADRHYTEDDLQMAEQLAERAGAAIANAKLYRAARDAILARDDFMLVAGHELRTPIAAMSLHHESLVATRDGTPLEKIRERGVKLRGQTDRLVRLVEQLLDVSRLAAGRLALEPEPLDLGELVRDICERLRDDLERAQTPLDLVVEPVRGRWDRARLDQVVTNLLTNALKYGKGAPIHVRVAHDGVHAVLTVADRGIGIAAADQPRIFKRFERAVSSRNFGGLGLGLWIASQLVEAHGGTIGVDSAPGAGATFTVRLPLVA